MKTDHSNIDNNPFGIPEGYFEGFEATIQARLAEEELREIVSSPGFSVPDGYFEQVQQQITTRLDEPKTKVVSLFSRKTLYTAVAVAAVLLLIVTLFNQPADPNETLALEEIDTATLESYLNSDAIAFTDAELLDYISAEDLESDLLVTDEITDESIETYLLENIDDIELLTTYEE